MSAKQNKPAPSPNANVLQRRTAVKPRRAPCHKKVHPRAISAAGGGDGRFAAPRAYHIALPPSRVVPVRCAKARPDRTTSCAWDCAAAAGMGSFRISQGADMRSPGKATALPGLRHGAEAPIVGREVPESQKTVRLFRHFEATRATTKRHGITSFLLLRTGAEPSGGSAATQARCGPARPGAAAR